MSRQKPGIYLLAVLCLFLILSACSPAPGLTPTAPVSATLPPGPYDGEWRGSGVTAQGKTINLVFKVENSRLRAASYDFIGQDGVPCTNISYNLLPEAHSSQVNGNGLAAPLGKDLQMLVEFSSDRTASGDLVVDWQGRHNCTLQFEISWVAEKTQTAAAGTSPEKGKDAKSLCEKINCPQVALQLLVFGLSNGAVLALNAISVTVVYGAVRTLNLAHGDVFSLTSALVTSIIIGLNVGPGWSPGSLFLVLLFCLAAAALFGMLLNVALEQMAFRPFRGRSRLAPLIATLGISFILFQAAMVWRTHQGSWIPGEHRSVPGLPEVPTDGIPNLLPDFNLAAMLGLQTNLSFRFNDLLVLLLAAAGAAGTYIYLRHTTSGRAMRACMENPTLAQMIGIDLNATIRRAFAIGGLLAGVAAFVFAVYYGRPFGQNGAQSGLFAFTAALLGGVGNPLGALASALLLGVFSAFSDYLVRAEWTPVLLLAGLLGLLYLRPDGFFDRDETDHPSSAILRDASTPEQKKKQNRLLKWVLLTLAIFPLIALFSGLGWQMQLRSIAIFILLALGLNILLGLAGVLDLGYATAFGIGAYSAAIISSPLGLFSAFLPKPPDFTIVLFFSAAMAGLFGLVKSSLTMRLRDDFLALATLGLGLLVPRLVVNLKFLTGGAAGISPLPAPNLLGWSFANPTAGYYLVFGLLAVTALFSLRILNSRTGRAWLAISNDETAASAAGVDIGRRRLQAMVISSILAGAAGALYAASFAYVDPEILSFHWTAMLLTMVILGGGNISGVMLGAILIVGYDKLLIPQLSALIALVWPRDFFIGSVPDLRGTSFFNFGIILYLTVWLRVRERKGKKSFSPWD